MPEQKLLCPVCEEGHLSLSAYVGEIVHNGSTLSVDGLECYRCDKCGADPVLEEQIRRNHRRYSDARRRADGLLSGDEVRAVRERFGLTQQQAASLYGGGTNAFSKYERGDVIQSVAMDRLIRLSMRFPFLINSLAEEAGIAIEMNSANYKYTSARKISISIWQTTFAPSSNNRKVVYVSDWQHGRAA